MLEKNKKKIKAKKFRVVITCRLGIIEHELATRPSRSKIKAATRKTLLQEKW